jgi:hypothetical protein
MFCRPLLRRAKGCATPLPRRRVDGKPSKINRNPVKFFPLKNRARQKILNEGVGAVKKTL